MATIDRNLPILKLPPAPKVYNQQDQDQFRRAMEQHWHPQGPTNASVQGFATVILPIDNGSNPITDGMYVSVPITFDYTIKGYRLIEDCGASGSIVLRVDYATDSAFPVFTEISGTQRPTLANSYAEERNAVDGWTLTTGVANSQLRATVIGNATTVTRVALAIALEETNTGTTTASSSSSSSGGTTTVSGTAAAWHDGHGTPSSSLGNDGDYYLDDDSLDVYAKASGIWTIVTNLSAAQNDIVTVPYSDPNDVRVVDPDTDFSIVFDSSGNVIFV